MTRHSRPCDPARDFCQWPYQRPADPSPGALRQESILFDLVSVSHPRPLFSSRLRAVQEAAGRFNTVWGLKSDGLTLSVELYFYDYRRENRSLPVARIADAVPGLIDPGVTVPDRVPYFMWSVEPDVDCLQTASDIDIYCNGFGGTISGGICYAVSAEGAELKNTYHFFDSRTDRSEILEALRSNPRFPGLKSFPAFLMPGSWTEETYVVSPKRNRDGIYFSRVTVAATIALLDACGLAAPITNQLRAHESRLQHHLFDVGVDYVVQGGTARVTKAALYGLL